MVLVDLIKDLFVNRSDCYARQYKNKNGKKAYALVNEPLTDTLIQSHLDLNNQNQLGVYQLDKNSMVKWGVADFDKDTKEDYESALRLYQYALDKGEFPLLEKSGGGEYKVHVWILSKELVPAKQMAAFIKELCHDSNSKPHEIFPKQDRITGKDDYGNLVKLPLGINFSTGNRSVLLTSNGELTSQEDIIQKLKIHSENKSQIKTKSALQLSWDRQERISNASMQETTSTLPEKINEIKNPYDDFMNTILRTELPSGVSKEATGNISGINANVLKNLAIWLKIKGYTLERLEQEYKLYYEQRGWAFGDLRGWFKKAENGDIMEISPMELTRWAESYMPQLAKLLPTKEESISPQYKTKLEVLTYTDLKKFKVDKNFIVQNFLSPGSVNMLYAPPAQFKSLISAGLGFAISNGVDFLGMKTKKAPVLYLDGENSQGIMKERAEQIHKGMRLKRNKFPLFFLQGGLLMDSKKNINISYLVEIEALIKKQKIKVIVFDTLHRFCLYDENSSDDLNKLYTQVFKPLADELKVAVVFLHHSTKSGGYRGSGDFLGMVDVSYRVERKLKTGEFKIINEKCRSGEIPEIQGEIIFGEDYIKFNRLTTIDNIEEKTNKLKGVTERIEEMFDTDSKLSRKDIISFLEMQKFDFGTTRTIDRALKFLVEQKKTLDKSGLGVYSLI
jgi:hypothetical protein